MKSLEFIADYCFICYYLHRKKQKKGWKNEK